MMHVQTQIRFTHFKFSNFFPENGAVNEIMWKNFAELVRAQITIWRMRIASWIQNDTNKLSEYNYCFPTATVLARTRRDVTIYGLNIGLSCETFTIGLNSCFICFQKC